MRGVSALLIAIIFVIKYQSVGGTPVSEEERVTSDETQRRMKIFHPAGRDWTSFSESWSLPSFPSLSSVSGLFKNDDDDLKPLKRRVERLEKSQKELHRLLGKMSAALATTPPPCNCKGETEQLSNPDRAPSNHETGQNEEAKPKPVESGIASDKKESEAQDSKDVAQSVSTAMKGEESSAAAPTEKGDAPPNATPTKTDGQEEAALEKNDDKEGNAPAKENEQRETTRAPAKEDGEKAAAIKETEKLEKPEPLDEFMNSQVDHPNGDAEFETLENNAAGNNTRTVVPDIDVGRVEESENDSENAVTVADDKEGRDNDGIRASIVIKAPSSEDDSEAM